MSRERQAAMLSQRYLLVRDDDEAHRVAPLYALARDFIDRFANAYDFTRKPELFVDERANLGAAAIHTTEGYVAIIPVGVYDFAVAEYQKYFPDLDLIDVIGVDVPKQLLIEIFFLFVTFHEYVHVARGHLDYLRRRGAQMEDSEYQALEYDADCFSTVMVYRLLQTLLWNESQDTLIAIVHAGIYWPLRVLHQQTSVTGRVPTRHPSFAARLGICGGKLGTIENITPDGMPANDNVTSRRVDINARVLLQQERRYAAVVGTAGSAEFVKSLYAPTSASHQEVLSCAGKWWEIQGDVLGTEPEEATPNAEGLDWKFEEGRFSFHWHG